MSPTRSALPSPALPALPLVIALVATVSCGGHGSADTGAGGASGTGAGSSSAGTGGSVPPPPPACTAPIQPADTSSPTAVVGKGTPESCTEAALASALAKGGVVTFDCGAAPVTITVTAEQAVKKDTVIDGGGSVTLSGGGKTRILHLVSAWNVTTPKLTVQHLAFTGGFTTDVANTKATTQGGAAIFRDGGSLDVIDCQFTGCPETDQRGQPRKSPCTLGAVEAG